MKDFLARPSVIVPVARAGFFLNAVIWLILGLATWLRPPAKPEYAVLVAIVAALMVGNAAATLVAGCGLGRRSRAFYFLALVVLLVNIVLTFTDEFGLLDFLTLLLDLVLLALLIAVRDVWLDSESQAG